MWPTIASPEQASEHWAAFVGTQLAGGKAAHAGDAGARGEARVCSASCTTTTTRARSAESVARLRASGSRTYHVKPAVTVPLRARPHDRAAERPHGDREVEERRRHERDPRRRPGVPVVPDPGGDRRRGTSLSGSCSATPSPTPRCSGGSTTSSSGLTPSACRCSRRAPRRRRRARERHHVADRPAADRVDVPRARAGTAPLLHRRAPRGARPHPQDLPGRARSDTRRHPTTVPTRMHISWGRHEVWKGVDLTVGDDATVIWWDATRPAPTRSATSAPASTATPTAARATSRKMADAPRSGSTTTPPRRRCSRTIPSTAAPPSYPSPAAPSPR